MSRYSRVTFSGAHYHVVARGVRKNNIFLEDLDFRFFLQVLGDTVFLYGWSCRAFCLMDNHYHLYIETPDDNLSDGMRYLNQVYAQFFNRVHDFSGHLFEGRFYSDVISGDAHMLSVIRYIELNPVRAGLVGEAWDWRWSSSAAVLHGLSFDWLSYKPILRIFGSDVSAAKKEYTRYLKADF